MAHYDHHQLLDDDELRMSLDDDMRALEALDADDHDVDMDGLQEHEQEDGDVFRPSAMLDRRMEEEFGGAFYSTCFQASELVEKDLDGGFVDIEQMLLSESEEFLTAHFANTSDELLHEQLLYGESGNDSEQHQQRMIRAELTARHFLHAQSNDNGGADQQQRLVLLKQAIASSSLSSSSIFNMPPKYFEGGVQSSPQKRRAHRRTFGERTQPFAFGNSNAVAFKGEGQVAQAALAGEYSYNQHTTSSNMSEAIVNDENCPPPPSISSAVPSDEVRIKEEIIADISVMQSHTVDLELTESEAEYMDEGYNDDEQKAAALDSRAQTPVPFAPFTGFRSISDDNHHHEHDDNANQEDSLRTTLRTPLRRSLSSPAPSSQTTEQQFTPQQQLSGGYASRSMSPADAFEKVAVVVQVVTDSPGRVDKFEWRIGSTRQEQHGDEKKAKKRPNLSTQLGTADVNLDDESSADSQAQDTNKSSSKTAALPPRYFRGVTSSPQKRRVHSTTFGSFARSFSFTGSAPPSDL